MGFTTRPCRASVKCTVTDFECGCRNRSHGPPNGQPYTVININCTVGHRGVFIEETPEQAIARLTVQNLDKQ